MIKMKLLFLACFLLLAMNIYAQEEDIIELGEIVITPARAGTEISKTPANVTVIGRTDINELKARTIPELLETQGAIIMRDYVGNGKTTNADIRGFGETGLSNVLVLVDGRRVSNIDLSGTDWTQIPISMVERIEILRGAASVLYGDNASGGVVNIITKTPGKKIRFRTDLTTGSYGTYGESFEFSANKGKLSFLGLFDQFRTDGYRINSDLIRSDVNGKLAYSLNDDIKASIAYGRHEDKYGMPGGLLDNVINDRGRRASTTPDDYANSSDYFVDFGIECNSETFGEFKINLSRRKRDTHSHLSTWMTEKDTTTYIVNPRYELDRDIFGYKNMLTAGIDYFDAEQDVNDGGYAGNHDSLALSKRSYGFYISNQFYLTDKFSLTGGSRYENAHYNFEQERVQQASEAKKYEENILSLALNYEYQKDSNIYASLSDSFRHPLIDEVYTSKYDFGFGPGGGLNTILEPQAAKNYELGLRHKFNKNLSFSLAGYIMKLHDEIYYETTALSNSNRNYDNTVHRGAEFSSDYKLNEKISLSANYTFTDAIFEGGQYNQNKIPVVPEHKWGLVGNIKLNKFLGASIFGNYVGERYFISDQTNSMPRMASYFTVNTRLSFDKGGISLFLALNNLFNEEYYEYGVVNYNRTKKNYYPAPERNFVFGGSLKF